ncbi:MAG: activase, partial [Desulfobacterales bacterium]|nr:activase [Desulfobacterales bacterium]
QNELFRENLNNLFPNSEILVLPESPYLEAFGASLYAAQPDTATGIPSCDKWIRPEKIALETLDPLQNAETLLDYRVQPHTKNSILDGGSYILGVDAGSTTTKAVLLNISDCTVGASVYLKTKGNPILATKKCLEALVTQVDKKNINIVQAGVTGSGREMVSMYLDNCRSFNEILAHARAAAEEVSDVDTVFEIGGQDSKFISFLKGIPVDYAMNEGCSAGTGSFIEESASVDMGIRMEDISGIAESSSNPIAFGERCAAFINTDLRNAFHKGANQ